MTTVHDEDLARRVYAYFVFRLRQPADAERLTQLTFERIRDAENLGRLHADTDLPVFAEARAVIAENPRRRGATKVPARSGEDGGPTGLSNELALAIGRLHGREREALALRFGAELSVGDIAELLDRTPADVKQRLARGARMLLDLGLLPKPKSRSGSASERTGAGSAKKRQGKQQEPGG
jgi:DNA-directed RNA polymerase specialized sigma24 family protein